MAQKTRLVIIAVSDEKVAKLERFLKNLKKKGKIVSVRKFRGEILEISRGQTKKFKSRHYEAIVCGGNRETKEFIRSLFNKDLIPMGKRWAVYSPLSYKFIRQ